MAKMTKEERREHRRKRRLERKRLRAEGKLPPPKRRARPGSQGEAAGGNTGRLGRRERRALRRAAKLAAKVATRPTEPVDRGPVTRMVIGRRPQFSEAQLVHHNLERVRDAWPGVYILRYEGEGYVDCDTANDRESAKRVMGAFRGAYPNMEVEWLK